MSTAGPFRPVVTPYAECDALLAALTEDDPAAVMLLENLLPYELGTFRAGVDRLAGLITQVQISRRPGDTDEARRLHWLNTAEDEWIRTDPNPPTI